MEKTIKIKENKWIAAIANIKFNKNDVNIYLYKKEDNIHIVVSSSINISNEILSQYKLVTIDIKLSKDASTYLMERYSRIKDKINNIDDSTWKAFRIVADHKSIISYLSHLNTIHLLFGESTIALDEYSIERNYIADKQIDIDGEYEEHKIENFMSIASRILIKDKFIRKDSKYNAIMVRDKHIYNTDAHILLAVYNESIPDKGHGCIPFSVIDWLLKSKQIKNTEVSLLLSKDNPEYSHCIKVHIPLSNGEAHDTFESIDVYSYDGNDKIPSIKSLLLNVELPVWDGLANNVSSIEASNVYFENDVERIYIPLDIKIDDADYDTLKMACKTGKYKGMDCSILYYNNDSDIRYGTMINDYKTFIDVNNNIKEEHRLLRLNYKFYDMIMEHTNGKVYVEKKKAEIDKYEQAKIVYKNNGFLLLCMGMIY